MRQIKNSAGHDLAIFSKSSYSLKVPNFLSACIEIYILITFSVPGTNFITVRTHKFTSTKKELEKFQNKIIII